MWLTYLSPDNAVATVKVSSVQMHGAAFAPRTSTPAACQLGQHSQDTDAHEMSPAMATVRGDYRVHITHRCPHTHCYGFLSCVNISCKQIDFRRMPLQQPYFKARKGRKNMYYDSCVSFSTLLQLLQFCFKNSRKIPWSQTKQKVYYGNQTTDTHLYFCFRKYILK